MYLSVVIPVYNEAETIERLLISNRLPPSGKRNRGRGRRLDGWHPEYSAKIQQEKNGTPLHLCFHQNNQGKGAAIRTALERVTGDVVVIQDADLEYHPEDYPMAYRLISEGWADAVYGSRFLGPHRVFYVWHYLGNKFLTFVGNILYNSMLTDLETGFKMIRAEILKALEIRSCSFDVEVEITAKLFKRKCRVYEIPITYTGRTYEEGKKITWTDGLRALWALLRFRLSD